MGRFEESFPPALSFFLSFYCLLSLYFFLRHYFSGDQLAPTFSFFFFFSFLFSGLKSPGRSSRSSGFGIRPTVLLLQLCPCGHIWYRKVLTAGWAGSAEKWVGGVRSLVPQDKLLTRCRWLSSLHLPVLSGKRILVRSCLFNWWMRSTPLLTETCSLLFHWDPYRV